VKSQRAYVEHVLECIDRISADSASGRDAVFRSHTLQDAIVRNIQVLCESVRRIDYFDVDFEAVWDVVTRDLPPLALAMRSVLARLDRRAEA
jgi:uncharacterized protein with HEPN domain